MSHNVPAAGDARPSYARAGVCDGPAPEQQDALAAMLLDEIESDEQWEASFEASHNQLEALADEALEEHRHGRTQPLDPDAL